MTDERWSPAGSTPVGGEADDRTVVRPRRAASAAARLRFDDGTEHTITGRTFVGRAPEPQPANLGGTLIPIDDHTMSVSKTHARFDLVDGALRVSDLGSTNGTVVESLEGERAVPAGAMVEAEPGQRIRLGDRWFDVLGSDGGTVPQAPSNPAVAPPPVPPSGLITSAPAPTGHQSVGAPAATTGHPAPVPVPPGTAGVVTTTPPEVAGPAPRRSTFECAACGTTLDPDAQFCTECGAQAPPAAPSTSRVDRRILAATAGVTAIVVGVGAFVLLSGGDSGSGAGAGGDVRLSADPQTQFRTDVDMASFGWASLTGEADHSFVVSSSWEDDEVVVVALNGEGEPRWDESINGTIDDYGVIDGDLVIAVNTGDDEVEALRLDGETGEEVWSHDLDGQSIAVIAGELYALDSELAYEGGSGTMERLDASTGESVARLRLPAGSDPRSSLVTMGVVIAWDLDDEEVQVYSPTFDELTDPIDVGNVSGVAFQDGTLATVDDDDIATYDRTGEKQVDRSIGLDNTFIIRPAGGGRWIVSNGEESEAVRLADDEVETIWTEDGQAGRVSEVGGRFFVVLAGDDTLVVDVADGEIVGDHDSDEYVTLVNNGYLLRSTGRLEAFDLPDGDSLWRQRLSDDETFSLLPDGYGLLTPDEDQVTVEVYR